MSDPQRTDDLQTALRVAMTLLDAHVPENVYWNSLVMSSLWRALHDTHTDESRSILKEAAPKPADEMG